MVFFETSTRLQKTISVLEKLNYSGTIFLTKELTKKFETLITGTLKEITEQLKSVLIKGEWCLVMEPLTKEKYDAKNFVKDLKDQGLSLKQIVHISTTYLDHKKNEIYALYHSL